MAARTRKVVDDNVIDIEPSKIKNNKILKLDNQFKPLNEAQRQFIHAIKSGLNVLAIGSAGTGKTYLALRLALDELLNKNICKIYIVRTTVGIRNSGFQKGSLAEKLAPYKALYIQMVNEICNNNLAWEILEEKKQIEFLSTEFLRGTTMHNCIVIADEIQNFNFSECDVIMTRIGDNAKVILCGDIRQNDLRQDKKDQTGLPNAIKIMEKMPTYFDVINFMPSDILRAPMVAEWITLCEELL